jgi:CheY-like chemotaxis protein
MKRILIVDDEPRVLSILGVILDRMNKMEQIKYGFEIVTADGGKQALREVEQGAFDLVISDVIMPGMGGVELVEAIRALGLETAVIWITAFGSQALQADRKRLDVHSCLDKPLLINEIRQAALDAMGTNLSLATVTG